MSDGNFILNTGARIGCNDLIDRFVAGDLDEIQQREVLNWLEEEPSRWRRCGLALLEARLWQETFSAVVHPIPTHAVPRDATNVGPANSSSAAASTSTRVNRFDVRRLAAIAALLLVGFCLGSLTVASWHWSGDSGATDVPVVGAKGTSVDHNRGIDTSTNLPDDNAPQINDAPLDRPKSSAVQTFAVLKLPTDRAGTREVRLPILEGAANNERWLQADPKALPDYVQKELARRGYQLFQNRRFLEVQLEDGRHAVIPVDRYQVKFVGSLSS